MRLRGDLATASRRAATLVVATMLVGAAPAAAEITVTTTSDPGASGDGQCSLREAIALSADCPGQAPSGATTIRVPAGTYTLSDQLTVAGGANLDIRGASTSDPSQTTIRRASDAAEQFRLLLVNGGAVVKLDGLTITGGRAPDGAQGASAGTNGGTGAPGVAGSPGGAGSPGNAGTGGGAIQNDGNLTIDHAVISDSRAGSGGAGRPGGEGGDGGIGTVASGKRGGVGADGGAGGDGGSGGSGGAIVNGGTASLTITNSLLDNNAAGAGGPGAGGGSGGDGGAGAPAPNCCGQGANAGNGGPGGAMGAGGAGGAIFNLGTVSISTTTIRFSRGGAGGGLGIINAGRGGPGGNGGSTSAFYNGTGGEGGDGGAAGGSGQGGSGGGILSLGALTLTRVTMHNNAAGDGSFGGSGGSAGNGGKGGETSTDPANPGVAGAAGAAKPGGAGGCGGAGGALHVAGVSPTLSVTASTIWNNGSGNGGTGGGGGRGGDKGTTGLIGGPSSPGAAGGAGGCGGPGGAAMLLNGPNLLPAITFTNSTIGENGAGTGGTGGNGGHGAPNGSTSGGNAGNGGGGGSPGGMLVFRPVVLDAVTVNINRVGSGGAGGAFPGLPGGSAGTAGAAGLYTQFVFQPPATVTLRNTIVRGPGPGPNCLTSVAITNAGGNIDYPDPGASACPGTVADPQLDPLDDYGGPTKTYRLHPGSPAIDGGTNQNCQLVDQRGIVRPQGPVCDSGAVEAGAPPVCQDVGPVHVPFGRKTNVQLVCSDPSGLPIYRYVLVPPYPQHGESRSTNESGSVMSYDPDPGFSGTDTFNYYGSSGNGDSAPRTITVQVSAPPAPPQITGTAPASPAGVASPRILGTAPAGTTVTVYPTADCSGPSSGSASAADFAGTGVAVGPLAEGTTTFHALATDADGIPSTCSSSSASYTYVAPAPGGGTTPPLGALPAGTTTGTPSGAPNTIISRRPKAKVSTRGSRARVVFRFRASVAGGTFRCSLDGARPRSCRSPKAYRVKPGRHRFTVRATAAGKSDPTPASFRFRVVRTR